MDPVSSRTSGRRTMRSCSKTCLLFRRILPREWLQPWAQSSPSPSGGAWRLSDDVRRGIRDLPIGAEPSQLGQENEALRQSNAPSRSILRFPWPTASRASVCAGPSRRLQRSRRFDRAERIGATCVGDAWAALNLDPDSPAAYTALGVLDTLFSAMERGRGRPRGRRWH